MYKKIALVISACTCLVFSGLWWSRAQVQYNEEGRYFDGVVVWHEQSIMIFSSLSVLSFLILVLVSYLLFKNNQ